MKKKCLSLILCVALCICVLPITTFAKVIMSDIEYVNITTQSVPTINGQISNDFTFETNVPDFHCSEESLEWKCMQIEAFEDNDIPSNIGSTEWYDASQSFAKGYAYEAIFSCNLFDYPVSNDLKISINGQEPTTYSFKNDNNLTVKLIYSPLGISYISSVDATIDPPVLGEKPSFNVTAQVNIQGGVKKDIIFSEDNMGTDWGILWYKIPIDAFTNTNNDVWENIGDAAFTEGFVYSCDIYLPIDIENTCISTGVTGTVNGQPTSTLYGSIYESAHEVYLSLEFNDVYQITLGDDQEITLNGVSSLIATCEGPFDKFVDLMIDGEVVDPAYYTAKSGSTIINVGKDYLNTLGAGDHTFQFLYSNLKSKVGHFTLVEMPEENDPSEQHDVSEPEEDEDNDISSPDDDITPKGKSPKTNDISLGFMLLLVSGAVITAGMKKKK